MLLAVDYNSPNSVIFSMQICTGITYFSILTPCGKPEYMGNNLVQEKSQKYVAVQKFVMGKCMGICQGRPLAKLSWTHVVYMYIDLFPAGLSCLSLITNANFVWWCLYVYNPHCCKHYFTQKSNHNAENYKHYLPYLIYPIEAKYNQNGNCCKRTAE